MMLQRELLSILRCPEDRSALTPASDTVVEQINAAIRDGRLVNRAGNRLERRIDGGLMRAANDVLYPIMDQIPVLLRDEAISLDHLGEPSRGLGL